MYSAFQRSGSAGPDQNGTSCVLCLVSPSRCERRSVTERSNARHTAAGFHRYISSAQPDNRYRRMRLRHTAAPVAASPARLQTVWPGSIPKPPIPIGTLLLSTNAPNTSCDLARWQFIPFRHEPKAASTLSSDARAELRMLVLMKPLSSTALKKSVSRTPL